ncbi:hypothetical protein SAMN04487943_11525 [Gracilibacillus orientalis]|uniref:Uncharacterized protein n=1 Tax=Gracilibacillus orientalis TaxID=334253 RepID=A0A1I4QA03_9BACI|nr:hypothetical protein [Gracilibacillus orientalis]SFM36430.1 hypothetical protein SAMN04487943_11525 [Gracilibacillus orientalis]
MTVELGILISIASILIAALGVLIAYLTYQSRRSTTTKNDTKESAELKAGVDYIRKGVDDIRIDLRSNEKQMNALSERVARVDESTKQAHKRIDAISPD